MIVLAFLKKWWRWFLVGFSVAGAFIMGVLLKKKPVIVQGDDPAKKQAEDKATKEVTVADAKRQAEKEAAAKEHDEELKAVIAKEEKVEKAIVGDPKEVNDYLHDVGKSVREP